MKPPSNLPPGVSESMIPGNRPEDAAWELFHEWLDDECGVNKLTFEEARLIWQTGLALSRGGCKCVPPDAQGGGHSCGLGCHVREHVGLDRLIAGTVSLPDDSLGQDVAFLAFRLQEKKR